MNTIQEVLVERDVDNRTIFVVGGIVDRNKEKGLSISKAKLVGCETAKLAIGVLIESVVDTKYKGRRILSVNHSESESFSPLLTLGSC